ncbi:MAG: hypothetical protein KF768_10815 [Phycisphaeraceae bacterium]|nr:hypothetical protein [Phycisphaeraceae bacterium]
MILPRRASEPAPSRRHRPRTCALAVLALVAAWLLPALHAIVPHADSNDQSLSAGAAHHAGCCGGRHHAGGETAHPHAEAACPSTLARHAPEPAEQTPAPRHDHRDCELCQLIALGLHRPTPTVAAVDAVEPLRLCGSAERWAAQTPVARAHAAIRARGPPAA